MSTYVDSKGTNSIQLNPGRIVLFGAARWAGFGAFAALLSIALMAVLSERQFLWFYAGWFITAVVTTALLGALCTLCSLGYSRLDL
jgi:hypothetical protein